MEVDDAESTNGEIAPNATVYVRNINERVKIPALIEALRGIFAEFGEIQDIVAKKSLRRRGQAFIIYDDIESAQKAIDEINGFEVFGKQLQVDFAKTRSDITVKNEDGDEALEAHKKERVIDRERRDAEAKVKAAEKAAAEAAAEQNNKRGADDDDDVDVADRPNKIRKTGNAVHVPDEYVAPNKTLAIRDLPDGISSEDLHAAFSRFAKFRECRVVPNRPLAFIEFEDADAAEVAKRHTADLEINGHALRVNFRRT